MRTARLAGAPRRPAQKGPAPVDPAGQVQERASGTVDQRGGLFQFKIAHVAKVQIEFYACLDGAYPRLLEHRWR